MSTIFLMKTSNEIILVLSFFITLIMTCVTYLTWRKEKKKELTDLTELWASLGLNIALYYVFRNGTEQMIGLSMLGWIWPFIALCQVLEYHAGEKLINRPMILVLGVGGFMSMALGGYGHDFRMFTLPFALAVGGAGFYLLKLTLDKLHHSSKTPFKIMTFFFVGLLFLERITFPFWRTSGYSEYGLLALMISILGLSSFILASLYEEQAIKQNLYTENLMQDRNQKLLGQSKYSELGMMSAGIAHEINNPLAVIQARTTQLLRIYRHPDKQNDLADGLQQILYTSERINRTIQGVREFVHQDEKGPMIQISLKDLFEDVLAFCGQRMKNHGVNLRFYGIENFTIVGNKIQLEQIVLNLLNNSFDAIEFLPDKWIEVSCHPNGNHLRLYFKDSGYGIPKEIATKIMEPFYSTKDIGKGTGLGLALARGIAEKHGGSLQYLIDCPRTTFLLELPQNIERNLGDQLH